MRVVLDTSSLIYLSDFRRFDEILTVNGVVKETKDRISTMKLSALKLKVVGVNEKTVKEIKKIARKTGDLEKLSRTDIDVIAAAKENGCTIISDDRNIQNVAEKLGIDYISIFSKKITKLITWKKYCENCKKYFSRKKICPICGTKLKRVPAGYKEIKR